ncbi:MAG: hypothetical protein NZ903_01095 [Candidatus Micrarchaeota archaeon]|nr:hypothetical protein [Candidatus Micrarchaeota archaeon]
MKRLKKCQKCGAYTLSSIHCNQQTFSPHPIASGIEKNIKERIKARIKVFEEDEVKELS